DPVETEMMPFRGSDWAFHTFFEDEAKRLPSLAGEVIVAEFRQRLENARRHAGETVAAGRAVFELLHRIVKELLGLVARVVVCHVSDRDHNQHRNQREQIPRDVPGGAKPIAPAVSEHRWAVRRTRAATAPPSKLQSEVEDPGSSPKYLTKIEA